MTTSEKPSICPKHDVKEPCWNCAQEAKNKKQQPEQRQPVSDSEQKSRRVSNV